MVRRPWDALPVVNCGVIFGESEVPSSGCFAGACRINPTTKTPKFFAYFLCLLRQ